MITIIIILIIIMSDYDSSVLSVTTTIYEDCDISNVPAADDSGKDSRRHIT